MHSSSFINCKLKIVDDKYKKSVKIFDRSNIVFNSK